MKVVNFGSLNIDNVYKVKEIVSPGETVSAEAYSKFCGGKGLNQSIAFSCSGETIYHAGIVGFGGELLIEELKKNNVNLKYLKTVDSACGHTFIQVDEHGQNSIVCFKGSNFLLGKEYIDEVFKDLKSGDWILLQNEVSNVKYIIEKANELGIKTMLNPSPITEDLLKCPIEMVSLLILNQIEGRALGGFCEENSIKLIDKLSEKFPETMIVLTLGDKGSLFKFKGKSFQRSCFKVVPVDTTGAGDTFAGYFLAKLIETNNVEVALEIASAAAAIAITREGAAQSIPKIGEVDNFRKKYMVKNVV